MEYVLAALAAIGALYLLIRFLTWAFYRNKSFGVTIYADVRRLDRADVLDLLETISTMTHTSAGRAAFGKIVLITEPGRDPDEEDLARFLRLFDLKGTICLDD